MHRPRARARPGPASAREQAEAGAGEHQAVVERVLEHAGPASPPSPVATCSTNAAMSSGRGRPAGHASALRWARDTSIRSRSALSARESEPGRTRLAARDPPLQLLPAHRQGGARRRRGGLAPAARARRAGPPGRGRAVDLAAGGLARAPQGRADRPRGARRDRRAGDADAGAPAGRAVEAQRALRHRRAVQAPGPQRRRAGAGDDATRRRSPSTWRARSAPTATCPSCSTTSRPRSATSRARAPECCARASSS